MSVPATELEDGENGYKKVFDDGVEIMMRGWNRIPKANRWREHGHDRLYPTHADEGYIDLKNGEATEFEMKNNNGIGTFKIEFDDDTGKLAVLPVREDKEFVEEEGLDEDHDVVGEPIALIPLEVMG